MDVVKNVQDYFDALKIREEQYPKFKIICETCGSIKVSEVFKYKHDFVTVITKYLFLAIDCFGRDEVQAVNNLETAHQLLTIFVNDLKRFRSEPEMK